MEKGFVEGEAEGPFPTSQYDHTSVMATVNRMLNITDHLGDREVAFEEEGKDCFENCSIHV